MLRSRVCLIPVPVLLAAYAFQCLPCASYGAGAEALRRHSEQGGTRCTCFVSSVVHHCPCLELLAVLCGVCTEGLAWP